MELSYLSVALTFLKFLFVGSTIWMAFDAKANRIAVDKKPYGLNNGAFAWFLTGILLWIVTFPYYLWKRAMTLQARERAANPRSIPPIASPHSDGR